MKKTFLKRFATVAMTIVVFGLAISPVLAVDNFINEGLENAKNFSASGADSIEFIPMVQNIINILMGLLGIIAVLLILWGGFIYMTAAGDDDKVKKSKDMIISGIIGLIIIFAAWAIASFVINNMFNAATT